MRVKMITDSQKAMINDFLKCLKRLPDESLDYLTFDEADRYIEYLKEEKRELIENEGGKVIDFFKYYEKRRIKNNKKVGYIDWI
ncbi:hypothetical protein U732_84 [Clostridium argentinense CDC 2741]|uniref:Uncharacterized protein n=2 Tax=Clostridium argentinense TaxID=29341 RepID=A0A0C1UC41_9CLOT|nr:hypothetical protein [Clostridium argentinense]ARC83178.1 hypothetical protein RSJ17_00585 [Clostridium argentinense]KIE45120.1 hypothetical protein U732_84 [Clostridium argentinense CDC 2741]NFF41423.1 hypothetical protein [Clostridium argentinense]NFP52087.1 hypothetical protein [Clostridium argentinense]NFP74417.1 hypothetical protein [Clostridium argentinense]